MQEINKTELIDIVNNIQEEIEVSLTCQSDNFTYKITGILDLRHDTHFTRTWNKSKPEFRNNWLFYTNTYYIPLREVKPIKYEKDKGFRLIKINNIKKIKFSNKEFSVR